jgi:hypothetical protein
MTAYVPNHEKKKRIFEKRERELLHAINHDAPIERLLSAAEKVRAAKVSVYKCQSTQNSERQPQSFAADEFAEGNKNLRLWLSMSNDEIIALYRPKTRPRKRPVCGRGGHRFGGLLAEGLQRPVSTCLTLPWMLVASL